MAEDQSQSSFVPVLKTKSNKNTYFHLNVNTLLDSDGSAHEAMLERVLQRTWCFMKLLVTRTNNIILRVRFANEDDEPRITNEIAILKILKRFIGFAKREYLPIAMRAKRKKLKDYNHGRLTAEGRPKDFEAWLRNCPTSYKPGKKYKTYTFMRFEPGVPLDDYVRAKALSVEQELAIAIKMFQKVKKLHAKNILHRDLKPGNFLIVYKNGKYKLTIIDFEVGIICQDQLQFSSKGQAGTLEVMAPELVAAYQYNQQITAGFVKRIRAEGWDAVAEEIAAQKQISTWDITTEIYALGVSFSRSFRSTIFKSLCAAMCAEDPRARPSLEQVLSELLALQQQVTRRVVAPAASLHFAAMADSAPDASNRAPEQQLKPYRQLVPAPRSWF